MRALWRPAWYELDQALEVDVEDDFAFCEEAPSTVPSGYDIVFHNPLLDNREPVLRRARIVCIRHATLGGIRRIETTGLVYVMTLVDGNEVHVEAEETPGKIEYASGTRTAEVAIWDFNVDLTLVDH